MIDTAARYLPELRRQAREAADKVSQEISKLYTEIGLDRELYDVFAGVSDDGLDAEALRLLEKVRKDFTRSGVDKDDATRERIKQINERTVVLSQEFGKHLRDDVRSIAVDPASLDGRGSGSRTRPSPTNTTPSSTTSTPNFFSTSRT